MTSSRLISCAISGRLNEYELRPSLILTPGLRLTSPDASAAAGVKAKADEAIAIERVRNARRKVCPSMETSGVGPVYTRTPPGWILPPGASCTHRARLSSRPRRGSAPKGNRVTGTAYISRNAHGGDYSR